MTLLILGENVDVYGRTLRSLGAGLIITPTAIKNARKYKSSNWLCVYVVTVI